MLYLQLVDNPIASIHFIISDADDVDKEKDGFFSHIKKEKWNHRIGRRRNWKYFFHQVTKDSFSGYLHMNR